MPKNNNSKNHHNHKNSNILKITAQNNNKKNKIIKIFTDGCSLGNPGPGGYAVVILDGNIHQELSRGFRLTTNNRMELLACITALEEIKNKNMITIYSDSKYVINGINEGWAEKWKENKWIKQDKKNAKNSDLWEKLLNLNKKHIVIFKWIKGHSGIVGNERCNDLANKAATNSKLSIDHIYEQHTNNNRTQ